ncbi:hypothetical protein Dimus_009884 [Dionaea muscipula]
MSDRGIEAVVDAQSEQDKDRCDQLRLHRARHQVTVSQCGEGHNHKVKVIDQRRCPHPGEQANVKNEFYSDHTAEVDAYAANHLCLRLHVVGGHGFYFILDFDLFTEARTSTLADDLHFAIVTFSKARYDDLVPGTVSSKLVTSVLILFGLGIGNRLDSAIAHRTKERLTTSTRVTLALGWWSFVPAWEPLLPTTSRG